MTSRPATRPTRPLILGRTPRLPWLAPALSSGTCRYRAVVLLAAVSAIGLPALCLAATITADGSTCTLTDAILAANTDMPSGGCPAGDAGADTIVLDADLTLTAADTVNSSLRFGDHAGLPEVTSEITIQAGSHAVIQRDPGLGCIENDPVPFRLLHIEGGNLTLDGLTLRHGCARGRGGALVNANSGLLTVTGCTFEDNSALHPTNGNGDGGAIFSVQPSQMWISGSTFRSNRVLGNPADGGAIGGSGKLHLLTGCTFAGNSAEGLPRFSGEGGAVNISDGPGALVGTVSGNVFSDNTARGGDADDGGGSAAGGAVYFDLEVDVFTDNVFTGNTAVGGAATVAEGGSANGGAVEFGDYVTTFANNSFVDNQAVGGDSTLDMGGAASGGGVYLHTPSGSLLTLRGNAAVGGSGGSGGGSAKGGGYFSRGGTLSSSTLTANQAIGGSSSGGPGGDAAGGGWYHDDIASGSHLTIAANVALAGAGSVDGLAQGGGFHLFGGSEFELGSSILADNLVVPAGGTPTDNDCDAEAGWIDNSAGYNFVEAPGSCVFTHSGTDTTLVDPQLYGPTTGPCATPLADGSCLATLPLAAGSPAIDAGSCFAGSVTVDQRGLSRPFDEPGASNADDACDAGAVEWTDSNGNGIDDGIEIFLDGFESGDTSGWSATGP